MKDEKLMKEATIALLLSQIVILALLVKIYATVLL